VSLQGDRGFESHSLRHPSSIPRLRASLRPFLALLRQTMRIHVLESNLRMEDKELKYWIAFNRVSRVGRARMALLEGHFGALSRA